MASIASGQRTAKAREARRRQAALRAADRAETAQRLAAEEMAWDRYQAEQAILQAEYDGRMICDELP